MTTGAVSAPPSSFSLSVSLVIRGIGIRLLSGAVAKRVKSGVGQFSEQAPGPLGSPQVPQGWIALAGVESFVGVLTAKMESWRVNELLSHLGQWNVCCPRTIISNACWQLLQTYS